MGTSIYKSSDNEKIGQAVIRETKQKEDSPLAVVFWLLDKLEECRDDVAEKQSELDSAKEKLEMVEQKISLQLNKLDPETRDRLKRKMGRTDTKEQYER